MSNEIPIPSDKLPQKETWQTCACMIVRYTNTGDLEVIQVVPLKGLGNAAIFLGNGSFCYSNEGEKFWTDLEKAPENGGVDLCILIERERRRLLILNPTKEKAEKFELGGNRELNVKTAFSEYDIFL